ncbi:OLC1v1020130C1 [Oldenlandia corymbosa var. corymbosa]|uniref:OLC1v1020130C1 n=1 Tax=Oldenlandia corymbosa var. corymbosa TaxID=529605 RepID=A0AAV1EFS3_OLDCO|nr:OLC1v1020130C1 [Oldenlandia corymbosa var. corymbosa]
MLNALRSLKPPSPVPVFSPKNPYNFTSRNKTCGIRFQQTAATGNQEDMEKDQSQMKHPREESMASFGEGYATRSDEEGFGGVYGGNQELPKKDEEKHVHEKVPDFDTSQGSEVKEKEKARHQKESAT